MLNHPYYDALFVGLCFDNMQEANFILFAYNMKHASMQQDLFSKLEKFNLNDVAYYQSQHPGL